MINIDYEFYEGFVYAFNKTFSLVKLKFNNCFNDSFLKYKEMSCLDDYNKFKLYIVKAICAKPEKGLCAFGQGIIAFVYLFYNDIIYIHLTCPKNGEEHLKLIKFLNLFILYLINDPIENITKEEIFNNLISNYDKIEMLR